MTSLGLALTVLDVRPDGFTVRSPVYLPVDARYQFELRPAPELGVTIRARVTSTRAFGAYTGRASFVARCEYVAVDPDVSRLIADVAGWPTFDPMAEGA